MTDKRFAAVVIVASAIVLAALITLYVTWANQRVEPPPAGPSPTTQIADGRRFVAPPAATWPDDDGVRELPPVRKEPSLHPVRVGGKFGYIDEAGAIAIKPVFALAHPFGDDDRAAASDGRHWGLIDTRSQWFLPPTFDTPVQFRDGLAMVVTRSPSRVGYIDEFNMPAIPAHYQAARPFSEGYAAVATQPDRWGFIDTRGLWHIPPTYEAVRDVHQFAAAVWVGGKMGFIDGRGRLIVEPKYEMSAQDARHSDFAGRLAAARVDGKWGYIDRKGRLMIMPQFDAARPFSDGYAAVKLGGKWGFIDSNGQMKIAPAFTDVDPADEGDGVYRGGFRYAGGRVDDPRRGADQRVLLAPVATSQGWGFIDEAGQFVIAPQFKQAGPFRGRLARIETDAGAGYIDTAGKIVFAPTK